MKRKLVYFGTDVFFDCFLRLAEEAEILALYTYHNDEDYFTEYRIVKEAARRGIPVHYGRIPEARVRRYFQEEGCDFFFSAEYGYIIPVPEDLGIFRGVNVHSSYLPEGRGYYPIEGALERGLDATGVTMHSLAPVFDNGDILFQEPIALSSSVDSVDVYLKSAAAALKMTERLIADFDGCWARCTRQRALPPAWAKPPEAKRLLTHALTLDEAREIFRRYNKMTLVELGGERAFVTSLSAGSAPLSVPEIPVAGGHWLYRVSDGHLRLTTLVGKGKK